MEAPIVTTSPSLAPDPGIWAGGSRLRHDGSCAGPTAPSLARRKLPSSRRRLAWAEIPGSGSAEGDNVTMGAALGPRKPTTEQCRLPPREIPGSGATEADIVTMGASLVRDP